ncbi:hypothetical protein HETIRDRAFT_427401 [Heterobasidion irregulare TC 32-1]|uniref:Uncharacterized protein n=1 Tax=Heterobasidion irregulare (strain TC 32-1) TaxID=747525 RepID=W4K4H5_HETIT|nr:uncharacterized protein HETIRDRAFT_427401 [Heterobasidion irregulare TC 32-1]ETW80245.1 hypothetical protein HETIRDRAFT_427401 [Heterobasidion irregulare TC 32-1]
MTMIFRTSRPTRSCATDEGQQALREARIVQEQDDAGEGGRGRGRTTNEDRLAGEEGTEEVVLRHDVQDAMSAAACAVHALPTTTSTFESCLHTPHATCTAHTHAPAIPPPSNHPAATNSAAHNAHAHTASTSASRPPTTHCPLHTAHACSCSYRANTANCCLCLQTAFARAACCPYHARTRGIHLRLQTAHRPSLLLLVPRTRTRRLCPRLRTTHLPHILLHAMRTRTQNPPPLPDCLLPTAHRPPPTPHACSCLYRAHTADCCLCFRTAFACAACCPHRARAHADCAPSFEPLTSRTFRCAQRAHARRIHLRFQTAHRPPPVAHCPPPVAHRPLPTPAAARTVHTPPTAASASEPLSRAPPAARTTHNPPAPPNCPLPIAHRPLPIAFSCSYRAHTANCFLCLRTAVARATHTPTSNICKPFEADKTTDYNELDMYVTMLDIALTSID